MILLSFKASVAAFTVSISLFAFCFKEFEGSFLICLNLVVSANMELILSKYSLLFNMTYTEDLSDFLITILLLVFKFLAASLRAGVRMLVCLVLRCFVLSHLSWSASSGLIEIVKIPLKGKATSGEYNCLICPLTQGHHRGFKRKEDMKRHNQLHFKEYCLFICLSYLLL